MKAILGIGILLLGAAVLQTAVLPAFVPAVVRPDAGILIAVAILAFGELEAGLVCFFCLGLEADLFGSARFGLLTLCYMLAAGIVLWAAWREFARGDLTVAWIGGIAATALAHLLYIVIGRYCGVQVSFGEGFALVLSLVLAAVLWGLPIAWICSRWMSRTGALSPAVRERWTAQTRFKSMRRGRA